MSSKDEFDENIICSFCKKGLQEIEIMVTGGEQLAICNECIQLSLALIEDRRKDDTPFGRIPGEKYRRPKEKLKPISKIPNDWQIQETELFATEAYVTACSPNGKRHANFAIPKPLAWWIICNDKKLDVDALREEITRHLSYVINQTLLKY